MKKYCLFSVALLLLLTQFPQAQILKTTHSGIGKASGHYPQLLIVNGKPARLVKEATNTPFQSLNYQRPIEISGKGSLAPRSINIINGIVINSTIISGTFGTGASISTFLSITNTCIGSSFVIDYTSANVTFNSGNVFSVQLSDAFGSFTTPVAIGSLASTAIMGSISVTIPANAIPGSNYRIRVSSNDPVVTGNPSSSLIISSTNTWTGSVSSAWENAANWSCGLVPNENTDVIINNGTVIVNSNAVCKTLNVSPGVNFTVNTGFALTIIQ